MSISNKQKTAIRLYFNYLIHGMAIVILAQNMGALAQQWHVGDAGVSMVISSLGIGRLLVLYVSGSLSDRFGRKLFIELGILTYIAFFIGITFSKTVYVAYFFGILAGMSNSFLDSGTYPALMELFPQHQASANILIKAFASIGELILPIMVASLEHFQVWYGWSFIFCAVALMINFPFIRRSTLPASTAKISNKQVKTTSSQNSATTTRHSPLKIGLGIILTLFGYISMATFYLVSQWLTKYGESVGHLSMTSSRLLVSVYSVGSIAGVIVTAILVERVIKPIWFLFIDTLFSLIALTLISVFPLDAVMLICSFIIGCTAAGGVMQIGLTIMGDLFPNAKGKVTGIYYTASGLASFTIPVFTGFLAETSIHSIMWFDVIIALMGVIVSLLVAFLLKLNHKASKANQDIESVQIATVSKF